MAGLREIRVVDGSRRPSKQQQQQQQQFQRKRKGRVSYRHAALLGLVMLCLIVVILNFSNLTTSNSSKVETNPPKSKPQKKKVKSEDIILETLEPDMGDNSEAGSAEDSDGSSETEAPPKRHHHRRTPEPDSSSSESSETDSPPSFDSLESHLQTTVIGDCNCHELPKNKICLCPGPSEVEEDYKSLKKKTGCDIFSVPFNPSDDEVCIKTISDQSQWTDLKPMQQEYDERTIKFKAYFPDKRLKAIVKVPQKLFPHEAMSEVGSYHADRVMHLNRVPPTVWTYIPVSRVLYMIDKYGEEMKLIDIFAKDSKVSSYREWIEKDFINYAEKRNLITKNHPDFPNEEVVGVSVQLFVAEVRPLLSSSLAIPWVPHNDSWQQHMSPSKPFKEKYSVGYIRQSELAMYDFVLGNGDRSPNKNNFVVGACRHHSHPAKCGSGPKHPSYPSFITLDNGLCCYFSL